MTDAVTTAIVTASAAVITAITALLVNYRGFALLDKRIDVPTPTSGNGLRTFKADSNRRLDRIETRVDRFDDHDKRIQRLEDKP